MTHGYEKKTRAKHGEINPLGRASSANTRMSDNKIDGFNGTAKPRPLFCLSGTGKSVFKRSLHVICRRGGGLVVNTATKARKRKIPRQRASITAFRMEEREATGGENGFIYRVKPLRSAGFSGCIRSDLVFPDSGGALAQPPPQTTAYQGPACGPQQEFWDISVTDAPAQLSSRGLHSRYYFNMHFYHGLFRPQTWVLILIINQKADGLKQTNKKKSAKCKNSTYTLNR